VGGVKFWTHKREVFFAWFLELTAGVLAQHQFVHLKPFCSRDLQRAPMDGFTAWLWMNVLVLGLVGVWVVFLVCDKKIRDGI